MKMVNIWLALSDQALQHFKDKRRGYSESVDGNGDVVKTPYDGYHLVDTGEVGEDTPTGEFDENGDEIVIPGEPIFERVPYYGLMDNETFRILRRMADTDNVQRMFKTVTAGGKTYTLFSLYLPGATKVAEALDYLTEKWPGHFFVLGAWWMDGRQAGTRFEVYDTDVLYEVDVLDDDGNVIHAAGDIQFAVGSNTGNILGTPVYPVHNQTYKFMPDIVEYNEDGEVVSTTPPSSNNDLRDINVLQGQSPRRFM